MNIDQFRTTIGQKGFYHPSKFLVEITRKGPTHIESNTLTLLAYSAELPSVAHNAVPTRRFGIGPVYNYPTSNIITPITIGFYIDSETNVHEELYSWTNEIVESENKASNVLPLNTIAYKDDYKGSVEISCFNVEDVVVRKVKLYNAFPIQVGNVQLDWNNTNQIARVQARFSYDYFSFL